MFGEKNSKIKKQPPVRNCFTLAKPNKLVVIIIGLKVPKIKKILLYEMIADIAGGKEAEGV